MVLFLVALYGVEFLDELVYGLQGAVLPFLRNDLALTYTEIGLLLSVPAFVGIVTDPIVGLLADTRHRRALVIGGIVATALGLWLIGVGQTFALVLFAFTILFIASTAYVSLAQATLIDRDPSRAEQTMARWTLLGAIGVTIAPLIVTALFYLGYSWRGLYLALAGVAGLYTALLWRQRFDAHRGAEKPASPRALWNDFQSALKMPALWRWIVLTELADLMLDKLLEVTGLYFHDVVGVDLGAASFAVALFTISGLIGTGVLVPLLERVDGLKVLRASAIIVLLTYLAFLLIPITWLKFGLIAIISFSTSGWYPILSGRTYAELPGQSGIVVSVTSLGNLSSIVVPLLIGRIGDVFGLQWAMWLLVIGPLALMIGLPKSNT